MDWLLERQEAIEGRLARRHLTDGELALYDVSCSYFEGRSCPLARFGYDHGSGKRGRMQVEYGLLCDSDGRPVAIEAFEGSLKGFKDAALAGQEARATVRAGARDRGDRSRDRHQGERDTAVGDGAVCVRHRAEVAADQSAGQGGLPAAVDVR